MADDKNAREDQARAADRRQRERDVIEVLERWDETEPPVEAPAVGDVEAALESVAFPATGAAVVEAIGDRTVETDEETVAVAALVPETDEKQFESPESVRTRVQRPRIAAAMKRIEEASGERLDDSRRETYEKTLRALQAVDAADDDEPVTAVTDWIVDRIDEDETLPGSRAVRREAAAYCRERGYEVRDDEWLGV
ncbi:MAG: hypothetical protein ABEJ08_04555 [Halobacteriaceae archaeon]